jgi:6,7-dimethyl-8-ribityllumazine synthase
MSARYLIVAGKFNDTITKLLVSGAQEVLQEAGVSANAVDTVWVPGSFEIPVVAAKAARSKSFAAVICLGAVIRGETPHFDFVAGEAASGIMQVSIETGVPVIFGVLTTDTIEQALSRSGIKGGNKGRDAAHAALGTLKALKQVDEIVRR